jgi:hypothetical protein
MRRVYRAILNSGNSVRGQEVTEMSLFTLTNKEDLEGFAELKISDIRIMIDLTDDEIKMLLNGDIVQTQYSGIAIRKKV